MHVGLDNPADRILKLHYKSGHRVRHDEWRYRHDGKEVKKKEYLPSKTESGWYEKIGLV